MGIWPPSGGDRGHRVHQGPDFLPSFCWLGSSRVHAPSPFFCLSLFLAHSSAFFLKMNFIFATFTWSCSTETFLSGPVGAFVASARSEMRLTSWRPLYFCSPWYRYWQPQTQTLLFSLPNKKHTPSLLSREMKVVPIVTVNRLCEE